MQSIQKNRLDHVLYSTQRNRFYLMKSLKGQSNEIFGLNFCSSSFESAWATDQWVKIFSILFKISRSYSNFSESPLGMIPLRVNLPGVSYCAESISPGSHTALSHATNFFLKSPRGIMLRWVSLPGVSYCAESISREYATPGSHSCPWGVNSHFLTLLHRPLNGQCLTNKCGFLFH